MYPEKVLSIIRHVWNNLYIQRSIFTIYPQNLKCYDHHSKKISYYQLEWNEKMVIMLREIRMIKIRENLCVCVCSMGLVNIGKNEDLVSHI